MNNYKFVHFHIYEPHRGFLFGSTKGDRAKVFTVECNNSENCEMYKKGSCCRSGFAGDRCPYGKDNSYTGYTQRAKGYHKWINNQKEKFKEVTYLKNPKPMMAKIGEYVYLPYSFINLNENVEFIEKKKGFFSSGIRFIPLKFFTANTLKNIIEFKPHALMGGEILDYQKKEVPKIVKHLSEVFPEIFEEVYKICDRAKKVFDEYTNIGRKAKLKTLTPNKGKFVDVHKGEWSWDGEYIYSTNSKASFMLVDKFEEIRLKIIDDPEVKITCEEQVNENTVFVD